MLNNRFPLLRTAGKSSRGGFTLVELLVVIGIIAILAGVAFGPITHGLESAKESAGMQTARTIALAEFQYETDNGSYPAGTNSEGVASALVLGSYITDPTIFAKDKASAYNGTAAALAGSMTSSNICWDFMATKAVAPAVTNTGLSTSDPDGMPLIFSTGQGTVVIPALGPGTAITLNTAVPSNPFGNNGMAVCFKSNSAAFLKSTNAGTTYTVNDKPANYLFSPSFTSTPANYIQLVP